MLVRQPQPKRGIARRSCHPLPNPNKAVAVLGWRRESVLLNNRPREIVKLRIRPARVIAEVIADLRICRKGQQQSEQQELSHAIDSFRWTVTTVMSSVCPQAMAASAIS